MLSMIMLRSVALRGSLAIPRRSPHAVCASAADGAASDAAGLSCKFERYKLQQGGAQARRLAAYAAAQAAVDAPALPVDSPLEVFIEHTDTYGVVYYANYLAFFEGATEDLLRRELGLAYEPHVTVAVPAHKITKPAVLGDELIVRTLAVAGTPGSLERRFEHTLLRGDEELASATCVIAPADRAVAAGAAPLPPLDGYAAPTSFSLPFAVRHADVDARTATISLHAVLRAFERARTASLGGPSSLERLRLDGTSIVIAKLSALRLRVGVGRAGDQLLSRVSVSVRKQKLFTFSQQLCAVDGAVVAVAEVTAFSIDATTLRPKAAPAWCLERVCAAGNVSATVAPRPKQGPTSEVIEADFARDVADASLR